MILYSHSGPSLHSYECLSEYAILLDIIGPPYGENRPCKYYQEVPNPQLNSPLVFLEEISDHDQDSIELEYIGSRAYPEEFSNTIMNISSLYTIDALQV